MSKLPRLACLAVLTLAMSAALADDPPSAPAADAPTAAAVVPDAAPIAPVLLGVDKINSGDTAWMLASSALVLLMTPGLAFFYGGMVRVKAVLNMIMMSFISIPLVTVAWLLFGYTLAFSGDGAGGLIGGWWIITTRNRPSPPQSSSVCASRASCSPPSRPVAMKGAVGTALDNPISASGLRRRRNGNAPLAPASPRR